MVSARFESSTIPPPKPPIRLRRPLRAPNTSPHETMATQIVRGLAARRMVGTTIEHPLARVTDFHPEVLTPAYSCSTVLRIIYTEMIDKVEIIDNMENGGIG